MRIGFVVNPIAGMGGRVGLKGTDGKVAAARDRGAEPRAPERAKRTLQALSANLDTHDEYQLFTWGAPMGEEVATDAGIDPIILGTPGEYTNNHRTTAKDTRLAVTKFIETDVDLILFVGGDGTAADVATALSESTIPILGVPAGVKVYSSVFAVAPEDAAQVAITFDRTERREIVDIDEEAYRAGEAPDSVSPNLQAVVSVPVADRVQSAKQRGDGSVEAVAAGVAADIQASDKTIIFGSGSTVGAIESKLGIDFTPLGIDVWADGEVQARDATESSILAETDADGENIIIVSPIGGQGFIFGRGNPQLSPAVLRRCEIKIVASPTKLETTGQLHVDTGDPVLDAELRGWTRVRIGRVERQIIEIT
ncbi:ATP-NAD kinase family protein [Haloquadratum walsbyi]|uniref:Homolog to NAD kinase n=1 Tax=Haloquadratum walsbyi (strain DSM 16854 / JCM 12705 / C23) TaxID=768065 RepID=G0LJF2_HALWC|nr:ATP-NAD kinase family protein [Haloquadratum walsbyi]CCC40886.1 homolog to NAD kinase [Haloquadratum walsbyi C23]